MNNNYYPYPNQNQPPQGYQPPQNSQQRQQAPVYQPAQPMPAQTPFTKNAQSGAPQVPTPPPASPQNYSYPPYQPAYGLPPKKVHQPLSKKDNLFAALFFVASFLFVDFALFKGFHLGFTIAYAVIFVMATAFLWKKQKKLPVFPLACGLISLAGAATFALYGNVFINVIMFILICGLFTVYCLGISGSFQHKQGNFKMLFDLATGTFIRPFENIGDVVGSIKAGADKRKRNLSAVLGVVLALPVLLIIVHLLVKSDAAFEGLVETIAKNIGMYLLELVIAAVLLPYLFSYMFGKKRNLNQAEGGKAQEVARKIPVSGCVSFLCMISITYLIYLFSQLAYFFTAFKGILPEGYTKSASEFARRGFFEMFAICAINIAIISFINAFSKRKNGKTSVAIKVMSLFISLFSVLLIATAMEKMKLNITTYGFTRNRLLVSVFMLMMLVVIAFFIIHIFAPKVSYMQPIIIICSCMFVALSFANIDDITFNYNLRAYQNGTLETLDMYTISTLEPSEKYFTALMQGEDEKLAHQAEMWLIEDMMYAEKPYNIVNDKTFEVEPTDFRSYCKARADAYQGLQNYFYSLSDDGKDAFLDTYHKMNNGSYDDEEDCIYDYDSDKIFYYNKDTGKYDKVEEVEW